MLFIKQAFIFLLVFGVILGASLGKGQASSASSPQELLQMINQRFSSLKDYQCQVISTKYRTGTPKQDGHKYFFKKPHLIRLEVNIGNDKGAVAVFNKEGKVRAHAGGILSIIKITMEPNDKRLKDDDGSTFVESHLGGTIKDIEKAIASGKATIVAPQGDQKTYLIQVERPNRKDIIFIDSQLLLPTAWDTYKDGKLSSKTEWKNLQVDVGIAEKLFSM
jgi:outer membrane lipoprotein-sorting protein